MEYLKLLGKVSSKSQSAMEYLMTYGWAILIIAVVLVALFQLGVFNGSNFAPKAQAGACQVFRTVEGTSLEGTCNNMLPQYAAQFNGQSSYIYTGTTGLPIGSNARSEFAWIYYERDGVSQIVWEYGTPLTCEWWDLEIVSNSLDFSGYSCDYTSTLTLTPNAWNFVGVTYAAGSTSPVLYLNGKSQVASISGSLNTILSSSYNPDIGVELSNVAYFNGLIANVQIYNTSLSANDVQALYQEGIGGVPINTQNLVGWWPLNGNANDYSGNNNNGAATNVIYSGSWTNGYSAP